jgi:nitrate reductase gamma subunit
MHTKIKEYLVALVIIATFITYYFDLLKDGMMMSGIFAVVIMVYISMLWAEKIEDERDEYIRSKVDRLLYILTLIIVLGGIVYKTFSHQSYMSDIIILTILSLSKIVLSKVVKETH